MLIKYPRTVMVNKENYYQEYKGHTKWLSLVSSHFAKNISFACHFMYMLNVSRILFVQSTRTAASVKALVQVDFSVYALSKHKENPNLKAS